MKKKNTNCVCVDLLYTKFSSFRTRVCHKRKCFNLVRSPLIHRLRQFKTLCRSTSHNSVLQYYVCEKNGGLMLCNLVLLITWKCYAQL